MSTCPRVPTSLRKLPVGQRHPGGGPRSGELVQPGGSDASDDGGGERAAGGGAADGGDERRRGQTGRRPRVDGSDAGHVPRVSQNCWFMFHDKV